MGMKRDAKALIMMSQMLGSMFDYNYLPTKDHEFIHIPKEKPIPKGCKKYVFNDSEFGSVEIIALNEGCAIKKYRKYIASH